MNKADNDYNVEQESTAKDTIKTYDNGLKDAWRAVEAILFSQKDGGLSTNEKKHLFKTLNPVEIIKENTPQEVVTKIQEYEACKEIKRGDEVWHKNVETAIGIVLERHGDGIHVLWSSKEDQKLYSYESVLDLIKTGRNFVGELEALVSKIGA